MLCLIVFGDYICVEIEDDNFLCMLFMCFGSELSYVNDGLSVDVGFMWYDD